MFKLREDHYLLKKLGKRRYCSEYVQTNLFFQLLLPQGGKHGFRAATGEKIASFPVQQELPHQFCLSNLPPSRNDGEAYRCPGLLLQTGKSLQLFLPVIKTLHVLPLPAITAVKIMTIILMQGSSNVQELLARNCYWRIAPLSAEETSFA